MRKRTSPNESNRQTWLKETLQQLRPDSRLLDAGAGQLKNKPLCSHLDYVSQDFCTYDGATDSTFSNSGLHAGAWDTADIDVVSDITEIPLADESFHAVLCSEVLEHVPDPVAALGELCRLVEPEGKLILTAPFASLVHMAPFHFSSGFSQYWYRYHLRLNGFTIEELVPNGDWFSLLQQEVSRLGSQERSLRSWTWPMAYALSVLFDGYYRLRPDNGDSELACFGWHCLATKDSS